jgi:hypothetical protein
MATVITSEKSKFDLVKALRVHAKGDIEECDKFLVEDPVNCHISTLAAIRIEELEAEVKALRKSLNNEQIHHCDELECINVSKETHILAPLEPTEAMIIAAAGEGHSLEDKELVTKEYKAMIGTLTSK